MRTFLISFEQERVSQRGDFARYNLLSRSTNDAGSLIGRFEILNECYRLYNEGDTQFLGIEKPAN